MQAPGQVQRGCGEGSEGSREGLGGFGAETGQVQHGSGDPEKVPGSLAAKQSQVQQGSGAGSRKGSGEGQVTFNRDPEKVWEALVQSLNRVPEKVPEKVWEALVQSQVTFNRVPEKVPEKVWEALMQSQVRFNRVPKKVPEKVLGGCGAEPGQVQQNSREGSWKGLACRARSGSTGLWRRFRKMFQEALVQSQVRFHGFRRRLQRRSGEGFWESLVQGQVRFTGSTWFPALGFAARFRKICKNKRLRLLVIPPKLISVTVTSRSLIPCLCCFRSWGKISYGGSTWKHAKMKT